MITALDTTMLGEVSDFIAERMGLHFPEERWPDLARGLKTAGEELGFTYPDTCVRWLESRELTTRQIETLASHLTVGETYFFRDSASFEVLEQEILPPLIARRSETGGTLRLWSAGCCTGEEAYSIAITCARGLPDFQLWNVSILATDINPKFLAKAEAGIYSEWSFRGAPAWLRERFFYPVDGMRFAIDPSVKKLVHFGYLNLAEDAYPSLLNGTNAMDVIFCRNVLMYFTPDHQRRVAAALHRCLVEDGCLLVNPAEASSSLFPMFAMEHIDGVIFYRKTSQPPRIEPWPGLISLSPAPVISVPEPPVPVTPVISTPPASPITASPHEDPLALARTFANLGKLHEALASCREAIGAGLTNPAAYFLYATICSELDRCEDAATALGKVLYLDQDFILAHYALGSLNKRLGKHKESRRHLAIAFKLLSARSRDEIVPESDGMTCGRLMESVRAMRGA